MSITIRPTSTAVKTPRTKTQYKGSTWLDTKNDRAVFGIIIRRPEHAKWLNLAEDGKPLLFTTEGARAEKLKELRAKERARREARSQTQITLMKSRPLTSEEHQAIAQAITQLKKVGIAIGRIEERLQTAGTDTPAGQDLLRQQGAEIYKARDLFRAAADALRRSKDGRRPKRLVKPSPRSPRLVERYPYPA